MLKRTAAFVLAFIYLFCLNIYAYGDDGTGISSKSAAVIDFYSGKILYSKNLYEHRPIASTTKILTCLIACEYGNFNKIVSITPDMLYGTEGTLLYLKPGDKILFLDLIKAALIASANDAANAIAFTVAGSANSFSALMNKKAAGLKMYNSHFVTPSGLDAKNHYSCAYDMALLACEAVKNKDFVNIVNKKSVQISVNNQKKLIYNHNKLLARDSGFFGIKTGFTKKAGRCLVSAYAYGTAKIITVTLDDPDDWEDHLALVNFAKRSYNIKSSRDELSLSVADSADNSVKCYYKYDVAALTGNENLNVRLFYYPFIYKPYKSEDIVGYAKIYIKNEYVKTVEIRIV